MKIIYPYNEVLPLKRAHDAYLVRNCASLAAAGHDVTLVIGKGSLSTKALFEFYKIDSENPLKIVHLPILRRKNILRIQCNFIFFWAAQRYIEKDEPDCVICSVLKQADFHLSRKIEKCLYIYEVHQIQWYPGLKKMVDPDKIKWECFIFNRSDLVTVTTDALKKILKSAPYQIQKPIKTLPLACDFAPLKEKVKRSGVFQLFYVGQLYPAQGLQRLLLALKEVKNLHLHVVGGTPQEIIHYQNESQKRGVETRVTFRGFCPSDQLEGILSEADAFITTFDPHERMPYVAHTKLYEYQAWQKPLVAPDLDVVREHVEKGALFYHVGEPESLIRVLKEIQDLDTYQRLKREISEYIPLTWRKKRVFI